MSGEEHSVTVGIVVGVVGIISAIVTSVVFIKRGELSIYILNKRKAKLEAKREELEQMFKEEIMLQKSFSSNDISQKSNIESIELSIKSTNESLEALDREMKEAKERLEKKNKDSPKNR